MKKLMRIVTGQDPTPDQLTRSLHQQAQEINPPIPPGLRRRVMEALAQPDAAREARHPARWIALAISAAAVVVVVVVVGIMLTGDRQPDPAPGATAKKAPALIAVRPQTLPDILASANRLTPEQLRHNPLETELRNLLTDLSRPASAISAILPTAPKQPPNPKPAPPNAGGDGAHFA